jgi:hypothetical protein
LRHIALKRGLCDSKRERFEEKCPGQIDLRKWRFTPVDEIGLGHA